MWRVFVLVGIVGAAVVGEIAWKACHQTADAPVARHHNRCPPVIARGHQPSPVPAQVSGRVTKHTGGALAGATVALVRTGYGGDGEATPFVATTDAGGAWSIENVPHGDYVASATASEFLPANHKRFAVAAGEHHAGIDISLEAGGVLVRGTVSDFDGKPIAGARIQVSHSSETEARAPFLVLTDAHGAYELLLPDGAHWFTARHDEFTPAYRPVDVAGAAQSVDFKLVRGGTIRGVVIARSTGKPVPGAIVEASTEPRRHSYWHEEATANDDGEFVLRVTPPGTVSLEAHAAGVASAQSMRVGIGIGERVDNVRLLVDPAVSICGRVVEKGTRRGIGGANVYAGSIGVLAKPRTLEPSGAGGWFQIVGVRRGTQSLLAYAENRIPAQSNDIEVGDTDVTDAIIEMTTGSTLTGRIDPPGKASIGIVAQRDGRASMWDSLYIRMLRANSDASGAWRLDHVPPGKFEIVATTNEGATGKLAVVVADRDQKDLAVRLERRASVSGRVIDTNGSPVAGLKIEARPDLRTSARNTTGDEMRQAATSDANGAFKLVGLAAGTYRIASGEMVDVLLMVKQRSKKQPEPIEITAGADVTNIVVTVEPHDGVIRGVVAIGGRPARDVWVTARLQDPEEMPIPEDIASSEPVLSDANGKFVIDHLLRARTYTVVAEGPRGESRGETVGVKPGEATTIELAATGALTGHVKMRGAPVTSYDLECRRGYGDPIDIHVDAADGGYTIDHLAPGRYRCGVSAKAGNAGGDVVIAAGATTLDLTLVPWATVTGRAVSALDGTPVPHLHAQTFSESGADDRAEASAVFDGEKRHETDANGRFTIPRVANGPGHVSLWDPPFTHPIADKPYAVTGGARIDIGTMMVVPPRAGEPGTFGMSAKPSGGALEVATVTADGPASRAGIVSGDKITAIQGHTIGELTPEVAQQLLTSGNIGAGQTLAITLARGTTVRVIAAKL